MGSHMNARGEIVPLWTTLAEPVCHECMVFMMDEDERLEDCRELIAGGLSDYEARASAWPDVEGCVAHGISTPSEAPNAD